MIIRRALAERHDCRPSAISWKASLLLALADDREADATAARAAAAELLPRRSFIRDASAFALAVWDTMKPSRAGFPPARVAGLVVVAGLVAIVFVR
jgi:hypothetical protein